MMIATKMTRTPPSIRRKSNTRGPSSSGRGRPGRQRLDEQAGPGGADHGDRAPGGDVDRGRRTELVGLALGLDEDAPEPAGRDADRDGRLSADQGRGRERIRAFGSSESGEHHVDDREADRPADRADEPRLRSVDAEDLRREQSADAEHRHEPEQERHERHAADVEAEMERVENSTEDVVDDDGDEQQPAADQRADDEHQVVDRDGDHPPRCLLPLARSGDPWREAYDDRAGRSADQSLGPNRMESHDSSGVSRSTAAPRRTDADPGAPSTGTGTDGSSVNGIS